MRILLIALPLLLYGEISYAEMPVVTRRNVAHQGAQHLAPGNTLVSYRVAISAGADGAECDAFVSTDGVVFLTHDPVVKIDEKECRLTEMTYDEIRQVDIGSRRGKHYRGEKIPTLDEYLELLKDSRAHPVIDVKVAGIEQSILDSLRKHGMIRRAAIIAFSPTVVKEFRRLEPNLCVAWLYYENLKDKGTPEENAERLSELLKARCKELDTTVVDVHHGILSEKLVHSLRSAGIHVWCWTVNDVDRMQTLLDWGVESITTDRPELLTDVLRKRNVTK